MGLNALMMEGLHLMLVGMGIVFSFLVLLVGALKEMSWLAAKVGTTEHVPTATPFTPEPAPSEIDTIAVISAAIARYRRKRH